MIPQAIIDIVKIGTPSGLLILVTYQLITNPEKVEIWSALLNKWLSNLGSLSRSLFKNAHKRYVKHDLQGRVNQYIKNIARIAPYLADTKLKIEWIDTSVDRQSFIEAGNVVLRLKRDDPADSNFVHGVYWSVSCRLIPKLTRYVAPSQREALDLFVTAQIIEREKFTVKDHFLAHYLHPRMENGGKNLAPLYSQFDLIDRYGVFYPVLLQELYFLSQKVYGGPKDDKIIIEVKQLIDFLERLAKRKIGEEMDLDFTGAYCRFAVVIIGKAYKMSQDGARVYINYIQRQVLPQHVESIYLIRKYEYHEFIDEVCDYLPTGCDRYADYRYFGQITGNDDSFALEQYLVVLRTEHAPLYQV